MKKLKITLIVIIFAVVLPNSLFTQTLNVDNTFENNTEIFPLGSTGTIYGLRLNGNVNLHSDTSLVRLILTDNLFNEYLVYEAYKYICSDSTTFVSNECDETCYSEGFVPYSLIVQVTDAEFTLSTIVMESTSASDATNNPSGTG